MSTINVFVLLFFQKGLQLGYETLHSALCNKKRVVIFVIFQGLHVISNVLGELFEADFKGLNTYNEKIHVDVGLRDHVKHGQTQRARTPTDISISGILK